MARPGQSEADVLNLAREEPKSPMPSNPSGVSGYQVVNTLEAHGFLDYSSVPCSYFSSVIQAAMTSNRSRYMGAANEGVSLAWAAGTFMAGRRPVVMLQSSGFGNLFNPLTSLTLIFKLGTLMLVSLRAYPDGVHDEPQHRIIGRELLHILDRLNIAWIDFPADYDLLQEEARRASGRVDRGETIAWIINKRSIAPGAAYDVRSASELTRADAVALFIGMTTEEDITVSTTGMISRELFHQADRPSNFYMQGSMGHAAGIALGLAPNTQRRVFILDGDGALIMHLGTLSTIGQYKPRNLVHIVLDNQSYATTGGQPTSSTNTDFLNVATACGYQKVMVCSKKSEVNSALARTNENEGPYFIWIKIRSDDVTLLPRVTDRYSPEENAYRVITDLSSTR